MSLRNRLERLFGEKVVMELNCKFCSSKICRRGMRALLLADTKTELFSTDLPPTHTTALVGGDYRTSSCDCKISDVACLTCGNVIGYHVTQPCQDCLKACNNGHLWMFHGSMSQARERVDRSSDTHKHLTWASLPVVENQRLESPTKDYLAMVDCCR